MQSTLNLKIKYRESFRPFAPAVLEHRVDDYFDHKGASPYMLIVADVAEKLRREAEPPGTTFEPGCRRSDRRSPPSHVDYSARLQTVDRGRNPEFHDILTSFEEQTGCGVLISTSFNVQGEPIVCTPEGAYRCFRRTEIDTLVLEDLVLGSTSSPVARGHGVDPRLRPGLISCTACATPPDSPAT